MGWGYKGKDSIIHIGAKNVKMCSIWPRKYNNIYGKIHILFYSMPLFLKNLSIIDIKV